ncbi:MAG TPA: inorganic diphosphatase [Candidatus Limihabitans stercoravium]|nr:inorganic diphosphatase [Candidatus Limihabitans stercoravium]
MNIWKDINPKRISPEEFVAVVEISKGSKKKYEMDKETGMLILDRILYTSTHYPANYGFIPLTYAEDNDPLDVLILCSESLAPMSLVRCRPIGMLTMIDSGSRDEKIIAVAINDPNYSGYTSLEELPRHLFDEMEHFFTVYKQLEGKSTAVNSLDSRETAEQTISTCMEEFKRHIK